MAYEYMKNIMQMSQSPKEEMLGRYQEKINARFDLATDLFTVQVEQYATGIYEDIKVRIDSVISSETGTKMSDDYRKVIFKSPLEAVGLGYKFKFNSSTWLATNYDILGKPTSSIIIRKCRNVLRWIDRYNGALHEEEIVLDNPSMKENTPYSNDRMTIPTGFINLYMQENERSRTLHDNQRFYLNGKCYKVWSVYSAHSNPTDSSFSPLMYITVGADEANPQRDDIKNGIANINDYRYEVKLKNIDIEQAVGFKGTVEAETFLNDEPVDRRIVYHSSNDEVVSVSSDGSFEILSNGTAAVSCWIDGNKATSKSFNVTGTDEAKEQKSLLFEPLQDFVNQGTSVDYSLFETIDGKPTDKKFTCKAEGISERYYALQDIDGNHFRLSCVLKNRKDKLVLVFYDGDTEAYRHEVEMRGAW